MRFTILALLAFFAAVATAKAHHGFTRQFDASNPLLVVGVVTDRTGSPPHGVVTVQADGTGPQFVPVAESGIEDLLVQPGLKRPVEGSFKITVNPLKNTFVGSALDLAPGQRIAVLALRDCATGELRAVAFWFGMDLGVSDVSRHQQEVSVCR
jgi:hypothetical protein